ncbi:hypothetical protein [Bradyrhizobium sp. AUGA SZCCT0042]|uniref:hypothetical protein n=1 Tax=Bradyrhizobium sp. AUGA SZCCT0042 TaxID=2807651 RepID=UPI001BAA59A8|nr:hypothetical protein [Bradyrhizobium sp. AUGA SZCCT0042]MBR1302164.1 hypothetical protein [Bradyrhizobium sp. AUGA SZCCT0042]
MQVIIICTALLISTVAMASTASELETNCRSNFAANDISGSGGFNFSMSKIERVCKCIVEYTLDNLTPRELITDGSKGDDVMIAAFMRCRSK